MTITSKFQKLDDQELMGLIVQGHSDALTELYDRYGRLVYSIALSIVRVGSTAEEVTLDVFQKVWDRGETYRPGRGRVITWLTTMARNRAIDVLRREASRVENHSIAWSEVTIPPAAPTPSPEASTQLAQQKRRVIEAVASLPEAQRDMLALAFFQGLTHREIAEMTGVPLGTVKTRIRTALQKLQKLLRDEEMQVE